MTAIIFVLVALPFLGFVIFMRTPPFGQTPSGERLKKIAKSQNYQNGSFQNPEPTDVMLKDVSYTKMMVDFFVNKPKTTKPRTVPSLKTDLKSLESQTPTIVWFGHSSYLIKSGACTILVDPVLKGNVAPVSFFGKPFPGSDLYAIEDMPAIDIVVLTHDHYDHLHHHSVKKLAADVNFFARHLELDHTLKGGGFRNKRLLNLIGGKKSL